jgi:SPP1 gp7 family putative phage head morphogenesis protein
LPRKKSKVPLTRRRKLWAEKCGGAVFYGKPLVPNAGPQDRYQRAMLVQMNRMIRETDKAIRKLYAQHQPQIVTGLDASMASQARVLTNKLARKFEVIFNRLAPNLAKRTVEQINRAASAGLHASLQQASGGLSLKTTVITGRVREVTKAAVAENVGLIRSIPQEYFKKIQGTVMRSITGGRGSADVFDMIEHIGKVTRDRAALIARDQTSKTTTALNSARMADLGIRKFEWLHSGGGKEPRPLHKNVLDGNIYSLDDPPVIDDRTGEKGLPGQLINCRCRMVPVVEFGS